MVLKDGCLGVGGMEKIKLALKALTMHYIEKLK